MNVVMLGPPGAGKGTQAKLLAENSGFRHLSVGDLLRQAVKDGTKLGLEAKRHMETGRLVPDDLIIELIRDSLAEPAGSFGGIIFDGYPRTQRQAEALCDLLEEAGQRLDAVLNIELPEDEVLARLTGRRVCRQCGTNFHLIYKVPVTPDKCDQCGGALYQRGDDTVETAMARLKVYRGDTEPLVGDYHARGTLVSVDGRGGVEEVAQRLRDALSGRA